MRASPAGSGRGRNRRPRACRARPGRGFEHSRHSRARRSKGVRYEAPFDYVEGEDFGPLGHSVLLGDFVTTEDGTGLVHTALAFGEDDFRLGEEHGMTLQNPVTPGRHASTSASRTSRASSSSSTTRRSSRRSRQTGGCSSASDYEHAYPHCWRCGTPLIYYAKSSWYIRTTEVRDRMLAENEKIGWHPDHIKHGRFGKWLENNVDWALSRERYWGTPLPMWQCDAADCDEELLRRLARGPPRQRRRDPGRPPPPLSLTTSSSPARAMGATARCAACPRSSTPGSTRARCRSPSSTTRSRGPRSSSTASRPSTSARGSTRPAAGSTRFWPSPPSFSTRPRTRTASAWA